MTQERFDEISKIIGKYREKGKELKALYLLHLRFCNDISVMQGNDEFHRSIQQFIDETGVTAQELFDYSKMLI